jgi:CheY-like chemotaxis protein
MPLYRALSGQSVTNEDVVIVSRTGQAGSVLASDRAMTDGDGSGMGAVFTIHNLTERNLADATLLDTGRKQEEEVVRQAKELAEAASCPRPLRLLMAEDFVDNQMLFQAYLKKSPHHLVIVNNGAEAVAMLKEESFDLVLMDLQMPIMGGHEATRQIRQWEKETHRVPMVIIALSAHASVGHQKDSLAAGCNEHVVKPIRKRTLLAILAKYANHSPEQ